MHFAQQSVCRCPVGTLGALSGTSVLAADSPPRTVKLRNGAVVAGVGQGSWHLGQGRHPAALEEEALRTGISLGMTLIDTSGNYGNGRSEELISHVIAGQRDRVFLVSKVEANEVLGDRMARACEASLRRLDTKAGLSQSSSRASGTWSHVGRELTMYGLGDNQAEVVVKAIRKSLTPRRGRIGMTEGSLHPNLAIGTSSAHKSNVQPLSRSKRAWCQ